MYIKHLIYLFFRAVNPRRSLAQRTNVGNYVIKCLLPTLTKLFQHVGRHHFGRSFFG